LRAKLEEENRYLQEEIKSDHNFEEIVGQSRAIKEVFKAIEAVAPAGATVLITGDTGTGKELVARALHNLSPRRGKALIKVNCAALPAGLIESELFGHEKGAFTGAIARKIGRFELAHGGTLFLDEIGDLPLELQPKLLRVLQEGEFERIGASHTITVDVRVIAATNLSAGAELDLGGWPMTTGGRDRAGATRTLEEVEREHIRAVLELTGWRVSGERGAADHLGMKPTTLEARMKKLGITRKE